MNKPPAPIALLTDFGERDWFVGAMRGVILSLVPGARLADITHQIEPGDIRSAAFVLECCRRFFPPETVFLAVVDPGVGTSRRIIAFRRGRSRFIAPDNGLLSFPLRSSPRAKVYSVRDRSLFLPVVSRTFHGRDIFAPVAARLARGLEPSELGPAVSDPVLLPRPRSRRLGGKGWSGEIVYVDRFGNLITSIAAARAAALFRPPARLTVATSSGPDPGELPLAASYGSVPKGGRAALWGSSGYLEIAVNGGSAAKEFGLRPGDRVEIRRAVPKGRRGR